MVSFSREGSEGLSLGFGVWGLGFRVWGLGLRGGEVLTQSILLSPTMEIQLPTIFGLFCFLWGSGLSQIVSSLGVPDLEFAV